MAHITQELSTQGNGCPSRVLLGISSNTVGGIIFPHGIPFFQLLHILVNKEAGIEICASTRIAQSFGGSANDAHVAFIDKNGMDRIIGLSDQLARAYRGIIEDEKLSAKVTVAGASGAVAFTDVDVVDWRTFQLCDIGKWYAYCFAMMNRGVIPAAPSPDEQWSISAQHTKEDLGKHIEAFKEVLPYIRKYDTKIPLIEAI